MGVLGIDVAQRRARLGVRQGLAVPAAGVVAAAEAVVALHSTDPASVYLSVWARAAGVQPADVGAALYDRRELVRMLGMRRTVFVVPAELMPVVHESSTVGVSAAEHRKMERFLADAGVPDPGGWLAAVKADTMAALAARGEALTTELSADVPELGRKITVLAGSKHEAEIAVSSRVLFLLAADGLVVRGRPRGSWLSTQYRWAPVAGWLPEPPAGWEPGPARAELVRRWLRQYGPGTAADLKWWTGWTLTQTRQALAAVAPVEVDLGGRTGYLLPDDTDSVPEPEPWVALLPALDPTVMGWTERAFYLGDHGPELFDRAGNPGPTIWADGRIVGGWAQRRSGEIATHLLEDIGTEATAAVEAEVDRVTRWLGDVRVIPRFRTPLEKKLSAG